jgi:lysyl-tRNA synthetase class 2
VLLVSGDPVGAAGAIPGLLRELCAFAEVRGLKVAVLGAGAELLPLYEQAGLRPFYIGDEAIVDTASFSLEGRAIRKVRQSVSRLDAAGYTASVAPAGELDDAQRAQLEHVSELWRDGSPERGFSMAMDEIAAPGLVVVARDPDGRIRGFIHLVPSYGRAAMSLSHMRRDPATPNGLMEFLVVQAIELLRERGVDELSLNFAAFARLLHSPRSRSERALARLVTLANPFFQIESLYRFNAKFFPRWVPRYLLYEGALGLPRAGLAAMRIEGQVPSLRRS